MATNISFTGNLISFIQKRFLLTSAAATITLSPNSPLPTTTSCSSSSSSSTAQFLVNSCGLSLQSALSVSKKFQIHENDLHKLRSVVQFMKAHGFSETHLAKLIQSRPGVLHCRVEGNLKPKFEFLTENGVVGQLLPELVLSNTHILRRGLDSQIKPCFEFLKSVLGCNENVLVALKHSSWLLTLRLKGTMQPNYDLLIEEGVAVDRIAKLIMMDPRAIQNKRDKMISTVSTLKDLGLEPNAPVFIHALRAMLSISESTRKKKIEVLKSLGWSEKDIWHAFKRHPLLLGYSEEKIRAGMDFFVNTLKLGLQHVIACPQLLTYSIDKRLLPRYNVLKILESKKLIKKDLKIKNLLKINEKEFLKNYVYKYVDDIPGLLDLYGGADKAKKIHLMTEK